MTVHDTYVYDKQRRWFWNCPCGESGGPFRRRMDADAAAGAHQATDSVVDEVSSDDEPTS